MSETPSVAVVAQSATPRLDVLFLHGLTGDPVDTWLNADGNEFWPKWLCRELPALSIYTLSYPSSIFEKWAKKEMGLHERAQNLLEHLASLDIGKRPIVFVCHSLGGLLAKEMLRVSNECSDSDWKLIVTNTRAVMFLATPHTGASLASAIKLVMPRLSSTFVDLLSNESGYLTSLNQSYRDLAKALGFTTVAYYEKYKVNGTAVVVSAESADPGAGARPIAVDADHVSICKPKNRDALIFLSICRHLKKVLSTLECPKEQITGNFLSPENYGEASGHDRRDLMQKLIDAGREYEYQYANSLQNAFAQRYHKLGLFTEARTKSDAFLAGVEQRFLTHVYSAKICKGASDDEIKQALQTHVIDAMCATTGNLSPTAILQALYFLTEQCYIQWDVP